MAEGFTANLSRPEDVTGSIPTHESIGSVVGGALGGMAKILDVGLKASAEARQDKVLKQVDDQLYAEVNGWGPKAPGPLLVGEKPVIGDDAALDSAPGVGAGMKKIDNLMAANRQGSMHTAEVMGRASSIVQELIHQHPRFSDAIRDRAQKILGTNPTEAMIKLNENDEAMKREGDFRLQQAGIEKYQQTGGIMPITADGQIDRPAAYALGQKAQAAEYQLDVKNKELERDLKEEELFVKEHPQETETQFHQRIQAKMHAAVDAIADPQLQTAFNNLLNSDMLKVSQEIGNMSTADATKKSMALQTGLAANKAQILSAVDRAIEKMPPTERIAADKKTVREYYEDLFKPWEDLAKGPLSSFEVMTRAAASLRDKYNVDVFTSAPQLSALKALIGDQALGELVNQQFLSDTALGHSADMAVHNFLTNVMHISDGSQKTIPDAATAKGTKAVLSQYAKDPTQLGKVELANYHNTASAWVQSGMAFDAGQPGQVQAIATGVLSPDKLAVFDKHAQENPGDAKILGPQLLALARHNIAVQGAVAMQGRADTSMRNRMTIGPNGEVQRHNIDYGIQYNPTIGKFEIKVADDKGKDLSRSSLMGSDLPPRLIRQVNGMNESLSAAVHLKEYSNDSERPAKEDEYKYTLVQGAGVPVKEGALLPSQKKEQAPVTNAPKQAVSDNGEMPISIKAAQLAKENGKVGEENAAGAVGPYQIIPKWFPQYDADKLKNDAAYNEKAHDEIMSSLIKKWHGNIRMALAEYHGGPNTNIWGKTTFQYVTDIMTNASEE